MVHNMVHNMVHTMERSGLHLMCPWVPDVGVLSIPIDPKEFTGVRILGVVQKANTTNVLAAKCPGSCGTLGNLEKPVESLGRFHGKAMESRETT